jgi:DNA repair ATPase RecN
LQEADCQTDLQKLIYTMQTIHTVTQPIQFPQFWNEEWLKIALDELDSRKMTPDEKASLEILIARNAESVKAEKRKIAEVLLEEKKNAITKAIKAGKFSLEEIADYNDTTIEFVISVREEVLANE